MPELTRPSLYGAQHPIDVLAEGRETAEVVFVGPCCESGDILTPAPDDPEALGPRRVACPRIGDLGGDRWRRRLLCAMATINYNSYSAGARGHAGTRRHAPPSAATAAP